MDLAVIMFVAAIMLGVTGKMKQLMIISYTLAGILIGPHTQPFSLVSSIKTVNLMAELGIILLLFVVAIEYHIAKLRSIGKNAVVIAMSEAFGTFTVGYFVGQQMGMALFDSLFLALLISVTSTTIVIRVLEELGMIKDEASFLLLSVAVIEDIMIISMLAVLQSIASIGNLSVGEIGILVGVVVALIGGALYLGSDNATTSRCDGQDESVRVDFDNSLGGRIWTGVYCRPNWNICGNWRFLCWYACG
jgi:CPA2 family monovalent cation:H+ antiporter-2